MCLNLNDVLIVVFLYVHQLLKLISLVACKDSIDINLFKTEDEPVGMVTHYYYNYDKNTWLNRSNPP